MRIPTRVAGETIQKYVDDSMALFHKASGKVIRLDQIGPNAGKTVAQINFKNKIIYTFRGSTQQDLVEELLHFRQAQKAGYWGRGGVPKSMLDLWERQVDTLFKNLGFVPQQPGEGIMNRPTTLLVYRVAKEGNHVAARCICCDMTSPESWEANASWNGFVLETSESISFRVAVTDVSGCAVGPVAVYGDDEFLEQVDPNDRVPVLVAQNATYLELENIDSDIKCPFFVSLDEPTSPCSFETEMEIVIDGVESLPDVVDYDRRSKKSITDEWDSMAYSSLSKTIPFPVGCRFPATLVSDGRECSVVYMVVGSTRSGVAKLWIESSDSSVSHDKNATLVRRFRGATGKVQEVAIGKLTGSSVVSC
jgi:hypothetical protein